MRRNYFLLLFICFGLVPVFASAQNDLKNNVLVNGELKTPLTIDGSGFQKFKQATVRRRDKDGKEHVYTGVLVADILQKAGATLGAELHGINLTKYLLVGAADDYHVVFALAEFDAAFTGRLIILANQVDGNPLPATEGPFRIIIQDEKKPARCIRQVTSMKLMSAN